MSERLSGNKKYAITMKTIIGPRHGTIDLSFSGNTINGTMDILGNSQPLYGNIDDEGNCEMDGQMVSLVRTIDYTAIGKITEDAIELSLYGERNVFKITGIAIPESEDGTK